VALSPRRERAFRLAAWLLPFLLLFAAEIVCRLCGFGGYPAIIRRYGSDGRADWYGPDAAGVNSFFIRQLPHAGGMRGFAFVTPKPPGTVRIALVGESAMLGYPQELPLTDGSRSLRRCCRTSGARAGPSRC